MLGNYRESFSDLREIWIYLRCSDVLEFDLIGKPDLKIFGFCVAKLLQVSSRLFLLISYLSVVVTPYH